MISSNFLIYSCMLILVDSKGQSHIIFIIATYILKLAQGKPCLTYSLVFVVCKVGFFFFWRILRLRAPGQGVL